MANLEEYPVDFDYFKIAATERCAFYKQLSFCHVNGKAEYNKLEQNDFSGLAYSYDRLEEHCPLRKATYVVLRRFIGLLSSLTLYHFSNCSKNIYNHCLALRGLEYSTIIGLPNFEEYSKRNRGKATKIHGWEGMRSGALPHSRITKYVKCFGQFNIVSSVFVQNAEQLGFKKYYKQLKFVLEIERGEDHIRTMLSAVFHPGIEHVDADFRGYRLGTWHVNHLLTFCQKLKTLKIQVPYLYSKEADFFESDGWPGFNLLKDLVETWVKNVDTQTPEIFFVQYRNNLFLLHKSKLKQCLLDNDGRYYLDGSCDQHNDILSSFAAFFANRVQKLDMHCLYTDVVSNIIKCH